MNFALTLIQSERVPSDGTEQRKLAAIMFTDMVGYSALAQRNESLALQLLEEHRSLLRALFPGFNGREVKTIGDAFLVEFHSALQAAQCAIEIQRTLCKRNHDVTAARRIEVRIGIHIGDVVQRADGDVLGDGVNIASRIEPLAGANGICISVDVERQIRNTVEASVVKLGPMELKNIQVPMELFRIVLPWEKEGPLSVGRGASERAGRRRRTLTVAGVVVASIVAIGLLVQTRLRPTRTIAGSNATLSKRTAQPQRVEWLVVLPLKNYSGDTNQEFFVDGMTDILIGELAQISGLQVKSHTTSMRYKGTSKSVPEIGRELNIDAVIEGSVQRVGNQVLISVQLIEAATEGHLWAKKFQRDLTDTLKMQSELVEAIAKEIQVRLTPQEEARLARARPVNPSALDAYLKGLEHWSRFTPEGFQKAIEAFQAAIDIDPAFVPAQALLAGCYIAMANNELLPPNLGFTKGREGVAKALQLEESHEAIRSDAGLKIFFEWDWAGAKRSLDRALTLKPNDGLTHQLYSSYLSRLGPPFLEAMYHAQRAVGLEPIIPIANVSMARVFYFSGKYGEAVQEFRKTVGLFPRFPLAQYGLGWALLKNGQPEQALAVFENALHSGPVPVYLAGKAATLARLGRNDEARNLALQLGELCDQAAKGQERYVSPLHVSVAYAALGENQQALDWLDRAVKERSPFVWMIKVDPAFENIRSDPRFQTFLKKMNLTP